jgi:hypothetical protein
MDYKGGTHIAKWQWDQIYDPAITTSLIKHDEEGEWTTDGHYYTVQLIALMMGLDEETALKLGQASEEPDNIIVNNDSMVENDTWLKGGLQQKYHALTGGYHGVELAITAYALLKTHTDDESLRFLLHRLGDCFAHFDISHDKEPLTKNVSLQQYASAIERYLNKNVPSHLHKDWVEFMLVAKHGSFFVTYKSWEFYKEDIITYLPVANQNTFKMYGSFQNSKCFTLGHTMHSITSSLPILRTKSPDGIYDRKEIFLLYIANIVDYINEKYKKKNPIFTKQEIIETFSNLIDDNKSNIEEIFAKKIANLRAKDVNDIYITEKYSLGDQTYDNIKRFLFLTIKEFKLNLGF